MREDNKKNVIHLPGFMLCTTIKIVSREIEVNIQLQHLLNTYECISW